MRGTGSESFLRACGEREEWKMGREDGNFSCLLLLLIGLLHFRRGAFTPKRVGEGSVPQQTWRGKAAGAEFPPALARDDGRVKKILNAEEPTTPPRLAISLSGGSCTPLRICFGSCNTKRFAHHYYDEYAKAHPPHVCHIAGTRCRSYGQVKATRHRP